MKFLTSGDFGGQHRLVQRILNFDLTKYDFFLFTGDAIAMKHMRKVGEASARGIKIDRGKLLKKGDPKKRLTEINKIFLEIQKRIKLYGILGNSDHRDLVNLIPKIEMNDIHNRLIKIGNYYLLGYQGRPFSVDESTKGNSLDVFGRPFIQRALGCNAWPEEKAYYDLSEKLKETDPRKVILVTHYPPYKILDKTRSKFLKWAMASYGEKAKTGNIGSIAFRKILEDYPVFLHVFSHLHEGKGMKKFNETTCVNTGSLEEHKEVCKIEIKKLKIKIKFLPV